MARSSKLVERQQQKIQLEDLPPWRKQRDVPTRRAATNNTIPEENSTTFQTRAATNNWRLSSLRKTTLELPQAKRSRFVNSSLTVTFAAHFNEPKKTNKQTNKRAISTLKNCLDCQVTGNRIKSSLEQPHGMNCLHPWVTCNLAIFARFIPLFVGYTCHHNYVCTKG